MSRCAAIRVNGLQCKANAVKGGAECALHRDGNVEPSKLTVELADQLVALLRAGNYVTTAARAVGISRKLFYDWMDRGESALPVDEPYRDLRERVELARAEGEARNVAAIAAAARENWQAAAWLLERQYPERWGRVSVRVRDAPEDAAPPTRVVDPDDPFAEVDELADRRRTRVG